MNDDTKSDIIVSTDETPEVVETPVEGGDQPKDEPSQDPVKGELDKIQKKGKGKTELEKAIFTKRQIEKRIAELKGDTGEEGTPDEDDSAPVTVGMLKKMQKEQVVQSALSLAEEQITDEHELELTKHHLSNTIKPSGNAQEDFRNARAIVNAVKNKQITEEAQRKTVAKRTSAGSSAPGKLEDHFEPTTEELTMMRFKGYDGKPLLSKEDIVKARKLQK